MPDQVRPAFWKHDWPERWWNDIGLPIGWDSFVEKLPDGSHQHVVTDAEYLECEGCGIDDDEDDFDDETDPDFTPLTDGDVQRFLELWFPFREQRKAGMYTGPVFAVDEEETEIRPLDPLLQQPLLLLCTRCRLERMEELSRRPALEKLGCAVVLLTIVVPVVVIILI